MASKKPAAKKAAAKSSTKKSAKKSPAKKPAARKAPRRLQEQHYLPPWVVIDKAISAAIVGVSPEIRSYVVVYFDAPSGWVELGFHRDGVQMYHRTHYNNIVIEAVSAP
jgi:hypothetical protein